MATFADIWSLIESRDRRHLAVGMVASGLLAFLDMFGIAMILPLILVLFRPDEGQTSGFIRWVGEQTGIESVRSVAVILAVAMIVMFMVRGIGSIVVLRRTLQATMHAEATLAARLLRSFLSAPLEYHLTTNTAAVQRTLGEGLRLVFQDATVAVVPATGDAAVVVLVSLALLIVAPVESLVGAACLLVVVLVYQRTAGRRTESLSKQVIERYNDSVKYIQQGLGAVREIQLRGAVDQFADDLLRVRGEMGQQLARIGLVQYLPRYLIELGMMIAVGLVGATAFIRHPTDRAVAILAMFFAATMRVLPSLNRVLQAQLRLRVAGLGV